MAQSMLAGNLLFCISSGTHYTLSAQPENLLLCSRGDVSHLKLVDFGFARAIPKSGALHTDCGSPTYAFCHVVSSLPITCVGVPGSFRRKWCQGSGTCMAACASPLWRSHVACCSYGTAADMWAVGVIMFILLCGHPPFYHANKVAQALASVLCRHLTGARSFSTDNDVPPNLWRKV